MGTKEDESAVVGSSGDDDDDDDDDGDDNVVEGCHVNVQDSICCLIRGSGLLSSMYLSIALWNDPALIST